MSGERLVILTASYNDWPSLQALVPLIDAALDGQVASVQVVVVDDGSTEPPPPDLLAGQDWRVVDKVQVVRLLRNLGNQRALSVGVGWVAANLACDWLVVMDCDHEDRPETIVELLAKARAAESPRIVFAARTQRHDGRAFKAFYGLYKRLYHLATGTPISVGNFSVVPGPLVRRLAGVWEIGIHFPAGVMKARLPYATIGAARGKRVFGRSHMNLVNLVLHGLGGLAVHAEVVSVRVLLFILALSGLIGLYTAEMLAEKLFTSIPLLGWTSQMIVTLAGSLIQSFLTGLVLLFLVLNARNQRPFIPLKDHDAFVLEVAELGRAA